MTLKSRLQDTPYQGYTYSYPHKTAYRPLQPSVPLNRVWSQEDKASLFLYLHIPFCRMRCGFCNLFTTARPQDSLPARYLKQLRVEAEANMEALGEASFARLAVGGGTPTYLSLTELVDLFSIITGVMGCSPKAVPSSVEMSPETVTAEKLQYLAELGVDRASIGIQSFVEEETRSLRRPQKPETAREALRMMKDAGFATVNIDLIYGIRDQTARSWRESLENALAYDPEELYLYPLYLRPLTGLGRRSRPWDDQRLTLYRQGRDFLLSRGYRQVSMRMFRKGQGLEGPVYSCQQDAMVGLGVGARSYTQNLHYSTDWAVGRSGVLEIISSYLSRSPDSFHTAHYGIALDDEERRRRFLLLSLLSSEGLETGAVADLERELVPLWELDLIEECKGNVRLTTRGLERSDTIGPWLYSQKVKALMETFALR